MARLANNPLQEILEASLRESAVPVDDLQVFEQPSGLVPPARPGRPPMRPLK